MFRVYRPTVDEHGKFIRKTHLTVSDFKLVRTVEELQADPKFMKTIFAACKEDFIKQDKAVARYREYFNEDDI